MSLGNDTVVGEPRGGVNGRAGGAAGAVASRRTAAPAAAAAPPPPGSNNAARRPRCRRLPPVSSSGSEGAVAMDISYSLLNAVRDEEAASAS